VILCRGVAAAIAGGSTGTMPAPAGVWVPPRCQPREEGGWWILGGRGVGEHLFALPLPFICPALDRRGGWCVGSVGTFPPWDPRAGLVLTLGDVGGSPSPGGEGEGQ